MKKMVTIMIWSINSKKARIFFCLSIVMFFSGCLNDTRTNKKIAKKFVTTIIEYPNKIDSTFHYSDHVNTKLFIQREMNNNEPSVFFGGYFDDFRIDYSIDKMFSFNVKNNKNKFIQVRAKSTSGINSNSIDSDFITFEFEEFENTLYLKKIFFGL